MQIPMSASGEEEDEEEEDREGWGEDAGCVDPGNEMTGGFAAVACCCRCKDTESDARAAADEDDDVEDDEGCSGVWGVRLSPLLSRLSVVFAPVLRAVNSRNG
jgi:hypothetical protein